MGTPIKVSSAAWNNMGIVMKIWENSTLVVLSSLRWIKYFLHTCINDQFSWPMADFNTAKISFLRA